MLEAVIVRGLPEGTQANQPRPGGYRPAPVSNSASQTGEQRFVAALRGRREGRLVTVEPLAPEHAQGLLAAAGEAAVFEWLPEDLGSSMGQLEQWLEAALDAAAAGREVPFAILAEGSPVGSTRFMEIRPEHRRVEIGWTWLVPKVWGRGVNVETKLLILTQAFESAGARRVEFKTDARNARSRGALEALGAKYEGIFRKHMVVPRGDPRDSAYYSVIDDEWPEVKALLERRLERHVDSARELGGR
jgi:RimJ/RimL family protein N-acetyltransferase